MTTLAEPATDLDSAIRQLTTDYKVYEATFKVLREVHRHEEGECAACGGEYPCKTIRVMDRAKSVLDLSPYSV